MNLYIPIILIWGTFCIVDSERYEDIPRIVRGRAAKPEEFPFVVALHRLGQYICTSSLISNQCILTAAHCTVGSEGEVIPTAFFSAILGNINRSSPVIRVEFDSIIRHEDYNHELIENDIAIMKFTNPVELNNAVKTVCIPSGESGRFFLPKTALAIGWGRNATRGQVPEILQVATVDVTSNFYCSITYGIVTRLNSSSEVTQITERQVCAGTQMRGACEGDSGGPLYVTDRDGNMTIGISSFGSDLGCAALLVPAVYTSVSFYHDWIVTNAAPSTVCTIS